MNVLGCHAKAKYKTYVVMVVNGKLDLSYCSAQERVINLEKIVSLSNTDYSWFNEPFMRYLRRVNYW